MKNDLLKELQLLSQKTYVDPDVFQSFEDFLTTSPEITRPENEKYHVCAFCMPVQKNTKNVYLGHHIKADDWIPPGGHIEKNEHPRDTAFREFKEELDFQITNEAIELINISVKNIDNPAQTCKRHYSFWYVVIMEKPIPFTFDRTEFYDARWFAPPELLNKTHHPEYQKVIQQYVNDK